MATQVVTESGSAPGRFHRRDHLVEIEKQVQAKWASMKSFDTDAPVDYSEHKKEDKFLVTFPYPYMNGRLHLGHAFSVSKAEFAARFQRLQGKKSLFPFAFHCTGMPIQAAAMNLKRELEEVDEPEVAAAEDEVIPVDQPQVTTGDLTQQRAEGGVFKGKKTKAKAKSGGMTQSAILKSMGVPEEDIPKFTDPNYWLDYFPPYGVSDLTRFGLGIDWRRSFITTDKNPYYDSFIQWQFRRLKSLGKIKFGNRPAIFSRRENQPCADHDRRSGEGVGPQEYTLIKLRVKEVPSDWTFVPADQKVFLVAATLRPETMYGQTNCFVLAEGEYGLYQMHNGEVFVCSKRSATNMIFQNLGPKSSTPSEEGDEPIELGTVRGTQLIGLPLSAPLAEYDTVYALPMFTISMNKGTGIVTSVPADSPDDYVCLRDWKTRKNWRDQYGIKDEWVMPFEVVPVVEIRDSELGNACAVHLCENVFSIDSHKSKDKLEEAKKACYMKGFYSGILIKGEFAGKSVQEAKKLVKDRLVELGLACTYYEPESLVVSRSNDECVVALCDQWYITYGEPEWLKKVEHHIKTNFQMFNPSAMQLQIASVEWFKDWACSRTFGLGSRLPWDPTWLIESLSDSTIYMAYYTVAQYLQGLDNLNGTQVGPLGITVDMITDADWDYIFAISDSVPAGSKISPSHLNLMRNEFLYWYPMDLRVSGKDLITNHLTMSLYIHAAIWEHRPDLWPRAFFCNGMVEIDDQKMSKSLGNFLTMTDACDEYGADATRLALADAGDDMTKANFKRKTANDNILALTTLENWAVEIMQQSGENALRKGEYTFTDRAIENEINRLINEAGAAYNRMGFREALKCGWFEMTNLKEQYKVLTEGFGMHEEIAKKFATTFAVVMSPITPHFCEHLWGEILKMPGLVMDTKWKVYPVDEGLSRKYQTLQSNLREFRLDFIKATAKKGAKSAPIESPTDAIIFTAESYAPYQRAALEALSSVELNEDNEPVDKRFMTSLKDHPAMTALNQADQIKAMKFAPFHMTTEVKLRGKAALELTLSFNEAEMLTEQTNLIAKQLGLTGSVEVLSATADCDIDTMKPSKREQATPGHASILFYRK